jgi:hypothetical protein
VSEGEKWARIVITHYVAGLVFLIVGMIDNWKWVVFGCACWGLAGLWSIAVFIADAVARPKG